jgi:hypothetical protein
VEVTSVLADSAELAYNAKLGGDTQRAGWGDTATMVQNYRRRVGAVQTSGARVRAFLLF